MENSSVLWEIGRREPWTSLPDSLAFRCSSEVPLTPGLMAPGRTPSTVAKAGLRKSGQKSPFLPSFLSSFINVLSTFWRHTSVYFCARNWGLGKKQNSFLPSGIGWSPVTCPLVGWANASLNENLVEACGQAEQTADVFRS